MLRGWGFRGQAVTIAVAVTGIWNQFAMLGFPIIALAALTIQHEQNGLLQTVALIGLVVFVVAVGAFAGGPLDAGGSRSRSGTSRRGSRTGACS